MLCQNRFFGDLCRHHDLYSQMQKCPLLGIGAGSGLVLLWWKPTYNSLYPSVKRARVQSSRFPCLRREEERAEILRRKPWLPNRSSLAHRRPAPVR
jgi:hypothetical protein